MLGSRESRAMCSRVTVREGKVTTVDRGPGKASLWRGPLSWPMSDKKQPALKVSGKRGPGRRAS